MIDTYKQCSKRKNIYLALLFHCSTQGLFSVQCRMMIHLLPCGGFGEDCESRLASASVHLLWGSLRITLHMFKGLGQGSASNTKMI